MKNDTYDRYKNGDPPPNYETWQEEWLHFPSSTMRYPFKDLYPWKLAHGEIAPPPRDHRILRSQHTFIHRLLYLPTLSPYPRCKHKNKSFVARCEEKGDFSHSKDLHICAECRCKKAAGFGTKGDFYGIGENTGHLGCGLCRDHEKGQPRQKCLAIAAWDFWTIRMFGDSMTNIAKYRDNVSLEARNASIRTDVRKELAVAHDAIEELTRTIVPEQTQELVGALQELSESVEQAQFIDPEQAEAIKELLEDKVLERTHLTEYQKGKLVPMSSKTENEIKLTAAKTLSSIRKDQFKLDSAQYLHIDELAKRYDMHFRIFRRALNMLREKLNAEEPSEDPVGEVFDWATVEHKRIWDNAKVGAKK